MLGFQANTTRPATTRRSSETPDSTWEDALDHAIRSLPATDPDTDLFLEEREDLTLEATHRSRPVSVHNRLRGLSARRSFEPSHLVYLADPVPDDAVRLARTVGDPTVLLSASGCGAQPPGLPFQLSEERPASLLCTLVERVSRNRGGMAVRVRWVGLDQRVRIARSDRPRATDLRRGRRVRIEASLVRGGSQGLAVGEAVLPPDGEGEEALALGLADRVIERVERRLTARSAGSGDTRVVLGPGLGGVLIHELVGHALEADAAATGSWIMEFEELVASKTLNVIDDPRQSRVAWLADDEGELSGPTPLLEDGRVVGRLHDRSTARREGRAPTGHGRRSSYRDPVRPRMGCTFVAPGRFKPEEVLHGVSEGIYVRRMEAASVDPVSGRAIFRVTDADRIRNNRIGEPLLPHLLSVDAAGALASIDRIADDLTFDTCVGSCHRDGQTLAISVGAPTIRIGMVRVIA